jgi:hypothetical protein
MNKTLPFIIAFFACTTPGLNHCSDATPVASKTVPEKEELPSTPRDILLKELEVLHRPLVIGAIITAAMVGPVKVIAAGAIYAAILNREKLESTITIENISQTVPPVIKDLVREGKETARELHARTHEQAKELSQKWEEYIRS